MYSTTRNIAVIGAGNIGGRLAKVWAAAGHTVTVGARDPQADDVKALAGGPHPVRIASPAEAVAASDVVLLAVPASAAHEVAQSAGPLDGKIVIDAMNAVFRRPEPYTQTSEAILAAAPGARIVKCFNWIGAENMDNPRYADDRADMLLCGDDKAANAVVAALAEDCGFRVFDIGGLKNEPLLENAALLWGALAFGAGLGRNIAFKILTR